MFTASAGGVDERRSDESDIDNDATTDDGDGDSENHNQDSVTETWATTKVATVPPTWRVPDDDDAMLVIVFKIPPERPELATLAYAEHHRDDVNTAIAVDQAGGGGKGSARDGSAKEREAKRLGSHCAPPATRNVLLPRRGRPVTMTAPDDAAADAATPNVTAAAPTPPSPPGHPFPPAPPMKRLAAAVPAAAAAAPLPAPSPPPRPRASSAGVAATTATASAGADDDNANEDLHRSRDQARSQQHDVSVGLKKKQRLRLDGDDERAMDRAAAAPTPARMASSLRSDRDDESGGNDDSFGIEGAEWGDELWLSEDEDEGADEDEEEEDDSDDNGDTIRATARPRLRERRGMTVVAPPSPQSQPSPPRAVGVGRAFADILASDALPRPPLSAIGISPSIALQAQLSPVAQPSFARRTAAARRRRQSSRSQTKETAIDAALGGRDDDHAAAVLLIEQRASGGSWGGRGADIGTASDGDSDADDSGVDEEPSRALSDLCRCLISAAAALSAASATSVATALPAPIVPPRAKIVGARDLAWPRPLPRHVALPRRTSTSSASDDASRATVGGGGPPPRDVASALAAATTSAASFSYSSYAAAGIPTDSAPLARFSAPRVRGASEGRVSEAEKESVADAATMTTTGNVAFEPSVAVLSVSRRAPAVSPRSVSPRAAEGDAAGMAWAAGAAWVGGAARAGGAVGMDMGPPPPPPPLPPPQQQHKPQQQLALVSYAQVRRRGRGTR